MAMLNTSMDPNPQVKSGKDSVRSTKSLSIFVNPETPKEMARSEEVTMSMYADSPDEVSPTSPSGRGKRRHRDTTDRTEVKENRKAEKTGGFLMNFLKKKKASDTKVNSSSVAAVETTSSSTHSVRNKEPGTEIDNSINHQMEVELSGTNGDIAASSPQSSSTQGEQVKTDKTSRTDKTVELKSSKNGVQHAGGTGQSSAAVSDSNNNAALITIATESSTSSAVAGGTAKAGSLERSAGKVDWRKRTGRQQDDEKTELVAHSLPSYSPADVDRSSSAIHDRNAMAKFESLLSRQDSGGSGMSTPTIPVAANRPKKVYLRRDSSTGADASETGSAANTLTRQSGQHAQGEEIVSSAAIERMAEMQSSLTAGQVPKVITQMSVESPPAESVRPHSTENREYAMDSSADELSLQEDFVMDATEYYGQNMLTPTAVGPRGYRASTSSGEDRNTTPTPVTDQKNKDAVTTVSSVQGVHVEGTNDRNVSVHSSKTAQKSGGETAKPQHEMHTSKRTQEHHSTVIVTKTGSATQKHADVDAQLSSVGNAQVKGSYKPDVVSSSVSKERSELSDQTDRSKAENRNVVMSISSVQDAQKLQHGLHVSPRSQKHHSTTITTSTVSAAQKQTSGQTDRSKADRDVEKRQHLQETRAKTEDTRDAKLMPSTARQNVATKIQTTAVHSGRVERSGSPDARSTEMDRSRSSSDSDKEQHAQKTRAEPEEDRDSTPTPTTMRKISGQDSAGHSRSINVHQRSASPGAHGLEMGMTERLQRRSDQSDETQSGSDFEAEQRQHELKAMTQTELLEQAKRKYTTADAAIGDRNVRTAAKSTFTVSTSTHTSRGTDNVEKVPSKASLDQRDESSAKSSGLRDGFKDRMMDGGEYRASGRSGRVEVNHRQPVTDGYGDGTNMDDDTPELRSHMRPREHRPTARSHSNASSDISSSVGSRSSVDHQYQPAESNPRRIERRGSHSSSDATPTETDNVRSYRGRMTVPTSREPIRRTTSLPMSDDVDAAGDPAVMDFRDRQGYHVAPVLDTRQPTAVLYAGRTAAPVSGRQKIKRTTERPEDDDEAASISEPRSGRIYVDHGSDRLISNAEIYDRARRQRQTPSSRPRINHSADISGSSSSPEDTHASSEQPYAERRAPNVHREYDHDPDMAVHHSTQRHAPTSRTKKIPRSGDVDIRVISSSPDRARTPTSIDDRQYHQMQNVDTKVSYNRRAPAGRTGRIPHGSNLDISISGLPNKRIPDGHTTPASTSDWLRHQRSGQLTVDVVGTDGSPSNLHRAYRSMPDLMHDYRSADEAVPNRNLQNYPDNYDDDNADQVVHRRPVSSNPGGFRSGRVTATIRDTVTEPRYPEQVDVHYNRPRHFSSSEVDQRGGPAGGTGRKRGFITGATVENRGGRGRRSGRTDDMPMTDVEDLYDSSYRPSYVARIRVGGDDDNVEMESPDDVQSVFSEPPQLGRPRSTNTLLFRSVTPNRPSAILTPAYGPPPTMPVPQGAFELAHVDTQIHQQLSPDLGSPEATISAVDPALRGASKHGTNYHITLTLKPTITTTSPRPGTMTSRSQMMTSSHMMTSSQTLPSQGDPYASLWSQPPRPVSSMAVYTNDNPDWTTSQPDDRPSPRRQTTLPTRPSRGTSTAVPTSRPRPRSRSVTRSPDEQIGFDVEVRSISDDDHPAQTSVSQRQTITNHDLGPPISSSVLFTYSPPSDDRDPADFRRAQLSAAAPSPSGQHRPPQYMEDDMARARHVTRQQQQPQHLPDVPRHTFPVKNAIDTNKPPKVLITLDISEEEL